jgi:hypothetical protein
MGIRKYIYSYMYVQKYVQLFIYIYIYIHYFRSKPKTQWQQEEEFVVRHLDVEKMSPLRLL